MMKIGKQAQPGAEGMVSYHCKVVLFVVRM